MSLGAAHSCTSGTESALDAEIKIIGFYDPSNLDFAHNIKHSVFIYPNEKVRQRYLARLTAAMI